MQEGLKNKLTLVDSGTSIKNGSCVSCMLLFENEEIIVGYESSLHIHSLRRIVEGLSSLVYVIDLLPLLGKVPLATYQDDLSRVIAGTAKNALGPVLFSHQLNPDQNVFLKPDTLQARLTFLTTQQPHIKSIKLQEQGHLLIFMQDHRAILLQRHISQTLHQNYSSLYNTGKPIVLNTSMPIHEGGFCKVDERVCVFYLEAKNQERLEPKLCQIIQGSQQFQLEHENLRHKDEQFRKSGLQEVLVQDERVIICWWDRFSIMTINREKKAIKGKKTNWMLNTFHTVPLSEVLAQEFPTSFYLNSSHLFISTSQQIVRCSIKNPSEIQAAYKLPSLSDVVHINEEGEYLCRQEKILFVVETSNGVLIQLTLLPYSKDAQFQIFHYPQNTILQRLRKQLQDRKPINTSDIEALKIISLGIKKQLLNPLIHEYKQDATNDVKTLLLNLLPIFETKKELLEKLRNERLQQRCKIDNEKAQSCCYFTGNEIVLGDVVQCPKCNLYALKDLIQYGQPCYLCWGKISEL